jgi:hypothetical protein
MLVVSELLWVYIRANSSPDSLAVLGRMLTTYSGWARLVLIPAVAYLTVMRMSRVAQEEDSRSGIAPTGTGENAP